MTVPRIRQQTGYALILVVLGLMGVGGVVIAGFTQQAKQDVDQRRYLHNKRVLEEAKQALLMYTYRYPDIFSPNRGPGRLPCPDMDNNGTSDGLVGTFCIDAGVAMVGRFPWRANGMEFYDARDASGQRLWYAASQDFNNMDGGSVVNSDSVGSITIHDQNGQVLYDGSAEGIAAVIIAPGPPIARNGVAQDRSIGNGDDPNDLAADTDPGIVDPTNYLDVFGALDNADFVNDNAIDGFVLGPIDDLAADDIIVNDQIILVTTEEVVAMAQKATLQAYREALEAYRDRPGFGRYPWLDPYDSAGALTTYDAEINPAPPAPIVGRVPSIFDNYFTTYAADTMPFISELKMKVDIGGNSFGAGSSVGNAYFKANGDLVAPFNGGSTFTGWTWDGHPSQTPTLPQDGIWEPCPYVTGTEEDCNQDVGGNFIGGVTSDVWLRVREVTYDVVGSSPAEFLFSDRTISGLTYVPPTANSHAYVEAEYSGPVYVTNVTWSQDDDFLASHSENPPGNAGTWTYTAGDNITVGVRYYPILPRWTRTNGWHDMLQAAYAASMRPGGDGDCVLPAIDCLSVINVGGNVNNARALLVLSGGTADLDPVDIDFTDGGGNPEYFSDDLGQIFEGENASLLNRVFDNRPTTGLENDVVLVVETE